MVLPATKLAHLQDMNVRIGLQATTLPFDAVADMSLAHDALHLIDGRTDTETAR